MSVWCTWLEVRAAAAAGDEPRSPIPGSRGSGGLRTAGSRGGGELRPVSGAAVSAVTTLPCGPQSERVCGAFDPERETDQRWRLRPGGGTYDWRRSGERQTSDGVPDPAALHTTGAAQVRDRPAMASPTRRRYIRLAPLR